MKTVKYKLKCAAQFAAVICLGFGFAQSAYADGLIDNVNGITLNDKGDVIRFTGLVIDDDGRVKQLITRRDKQPSALKYRYDAKGKTMLPGLIDAHGHVMGLGFNALTLDLSDTNNLAEALEKIAQYSARNPGKGWIIGRGWNQEKWGLGRFPNAADLDAVVSDRPVWLARVDGHAGWANSNAMKKAGITIKSVSPEGGRIEKIDDKPSGIFVDAAGGLIEKFVPKPRAIERDVALSKAQDILLAFGVTSIADMGTSLDDWQSFRRAGDSGRLKIRIMSYAAGVDAMATIAGPTPTPWLYDDKLRMNGVKLYLDGALGSRGAWLKSPYSDAKNLIGLPMLNGAQLRNSMSRAAMDGFQVAVHAIGDRANAELLSAIEELSETYTGDQRWRIEHVQIVDPIDIDRLAKHGIISSMQPVHQTSDRLMAEQRLGQERLAGAYAWNSILKSGGRLAFGSDVPVESPNPFPGIAAAMTREDKNGEPFGGWIAKERVSRAQALAGFTTGAAYAGFASNKIGKLAKGHWADFILIDQDPMFAPPSAIRSVKVLETWVAGQKIYQQGH